MNEGCSDIHARLDQLRRKLWRQIGVFPARCDLSVQPVKQERVRGALLETIRYQLEPGQWVEGLIGQPADADGPRPAIVALHSHGCNFPIGKGEIFNTIPDAGRAFFGWGFELVDRGYVVLAQDQLCFEDRRTCNVNGGEPDELFEAFSRVAQGSSHMAKCAFDAIRAVDVLCSRAEVDGERIGAMGMSGGGAMTYVLGLCDPRVSAMVIASI